MNRPRPTTHSRRRATGNIQRRATATTRPRTTTHSKHRATARSKHRATARSKHGVAADRHRYAVEGRSAPAGQADDAGSTSQTGTDDGDAAALDLLSHGTLEVEGRLIVASNATMYCTIQHAGAQAACVYKPVAGERPLWDFPVGTLAGREVAAYHVSAAAGWNVVPPTVYRDGPFGPACASCGSRPTRPSTSSRSRAAATTTRYGRWPSSTRW